MKTASKLQLKELINFYTERKFARNARRASGARLGGPRVGVVCVSVRVCRNACAKKCVFLYMLHT